MSEAHRETTRSLLVEYCVMVMENSSSFLKYALQRGAIIDPLETEAWVAKPRPAWKNHRRNGCGPTGVRYFQAGMGNRIS